MPEQNNKAFHCKNIRYLFSLCDVLLILLLTVLLYPTVYTDYCCVKLEFLKLSAPSATNVSAGEVKGDVLGSHPDKHEPIVLKTISFHVISVMKSLKAQCNCIFKASVGALLIVVNGFACFVLKGHL